MQMCSPAGFAISFRLPCATAPKENLPTQQPDEVLAALESSCCNVLRRGVEILSPPQAG